MDKLKESQARAEGNHDDPLSNKHQVLSLRTSVELITKTEPEEREGWEPK